ncbi:Uncharacterized protein APZ42_023545 [Daphnia magna]|uniref:Uncharacterized protein n=1 Tax=Daphnia magna TaxID=35525 RepID=A0A0P5XL49_9CRUS|nr:Uncharacterized protein APZ42_023545 [Daphnia magna]
MANRMQRYEAQMRLFEPEANLPVLSEVPLRPKAGFQYIYKWDSTTKRKDWRADGYRWRQNATVKFKHDEANCKRYYFKLKVGPGNDYTNDFSKHAIECSLYDKQLLIWYQGDDSVVVDFSHGNAKDTEKEFRRTTPSILSQMKSVKEKLPLEVYSELIHQPEGDTMDASINTQQIHNAQKSAQKAEHLSLDTLCNLNELRSETHFVSDIHLAPSLLVICFKTNTIEEFKHLFHREDLFTPSLSYDSSTFQMDDYNLSILTYRQTEFEDLPVTPLMYMIHEKKVEKAHNFFFMRLNELIPELKAVETMIIATENDEAIVNAMQKYIPHVTIFRNWQHALQDINKSLQNLEITDCHEVKEYESDFIRLLDQESCGDYKSILAQMYLKKWNRDFSNYFDEHIDGHMNRMGAWAFRPFGLSLDAIDCSSNESLYSTLKRFDGWKSYTIDMMVVSLMRIDEFFMDKITRGRLGLGDYALRDHLSETYSQEDAVPDAVSVEQLINFIECETKSRRNMRKRMSGTKRPFLVDIEIKEETEKRRQISQAVDTVVQELLEDEA